MMAMAEQRDIESPLTEGIVETRQDQPIAGREADCGNELITRLEGDEGGG